MRVRTIRSNLVASWPLARRRPTLRPRPQVVTVAILVVAITVGTLPLMAQVTGAATARPMGAEPLPEPRVTVNRTVPTVTPPSPTLQFSSPPKAQEIFRARVFPEPLVLVGGDASDDENTQLAAALTAFHARGDLIATGPLEGFLAAHPQSAWRASLLLNLGKVYEQSGAFSRALEAFDEAWRIASPASDVYGRAVADLAIAEWLATVAEFGQVGLLERRLEQLGSRVLGGSAASMVRVVRETIVTMKARPDRIIASGPEAVKTLLRANGQTDVDELPAFAGFVPTAAGMSLSEVASMATAAGLALVPAQRDGATELPVPAIVHWKLGHFSAVVAREADRYHIVDPALRGRRWIAGATLMNEISGYALLPNRVTPGWRTVSDAESGVIIGHSCPPRGPGTTGPPPCPPPGSGPGCATCPKGMPGYDFHPTLASLKLMDIPVGYTPARGPSAEFEITYNQREDFTPQIPSFSNLGPRWTPNWLSYVKEEPWGCFGIFGTQCYSYVWIYLQGGWKDYYSDADALGVYPAHPRTRGVLVRTSASPVRYERRLPDGTVEVFGQPDGAPAGSQRVFLTEIRDPRGDSLQFTYDAQLRLVAATDALGQVTTVFYEHATDPLKMTKVQDPFGRSATFTYNTAGQLASITDVLGLTSSFAYGPEDFVEQMTTPYGTTTFRHEGDTGLSNYGYRHIEATDPLGGTERLTFDLEIPELPVTESASLVPTGFDAWNADLNYSNTLYWDKRAWALGPESLTTATITHWMGASDTPGLSEVAIAPHSIKRPLERRVWYAYPGQVATTSGAKSLGWLRKPSRVGRVLEDGASQIVETTYDTYGNVIATVDPVGRRTEYTYAANGVDLLQMRQITGSGSDLLGSYSNYNSRHLPGTITDAAGQNTTLTYNTAGDLLTVTNPKNETTTYTYDPVTKHVATVTGALAGSTTTYTYDGYGRRRTETDPDGYAVTTDYDVFDRVIRRTYPDTTYDGMTYDRLDLVQQRDRVGRISRLVYDALRRLVATRDPLGRTIGHEWCACGSLDALIDGNGNRTRWERDVQGRVTREVRADGVTDTLYTYDATGRLKTVTDPKDQVTTYTHATDDKLLSTVFTNAVIATPSVTRTYDPVYPRITTMIDGIGTTAYTYKAAGQLGAGQIATVDGPLTNDAITYTYDQLGRVTTRAINGAANTVTWLFDALGRATSEANVLGTFGYTYDGVTNRLATVTYPNGQTSTYGYLPTTQDHRLQTIHHKYPSGSTLSKFDYTYDAVGNILTWRQQGDAAAVLWRYRYDAADQLTSAVKENTPTPTVLKRYAYAYDPGGNRTVEQIDDAITLSTHSNLNRLTAQTPGGPMVFAGSVNEPATVTIQGKPATVDAANGFRGTVPTTPRTTTATIVATDSSGNSTSKQWDVDVAGTGKTLTYDANGNLTSDGTRTFEWDARNQLLAVNVGSQRSEFTYDGYQRRVRLVERQDSVVQSDNNVIWCQTSICEERAADGAVTRRPFSHGEQVGSAVRYFGSEHLGSVTDVTDPTGALLARYQFDPWGRRSVVVGTDVTKVGYTGHRWQAAGSLSLTLYRAYDAELGRWTSEDPLGYVEGPDMYAYVHNDPINYTDPEGLARMKNNSNEYIPYKPEGADNQVLLCSPGAWCNVDGLYSPPGSDKHCAIKVPDNCIAWVNSNGQLKVLCILPQFRPPELLGPATLGTEPFRNWPDPYTDRNWPWDPWDPNKECKCTP